MIQDKQSDTVQLENKVKELELKVETLTAELLAIKKWQDKIANPWFVILRNYWRY